MRFSRIISVVCLAFAITLFASITLAIGTTDDRNAGTVLENKYSVGSEKLKKSATLMLLIW